MCSRTSLCLTVHVVYSLHTRSLNQSDVHFSHVFCQKHHRKLMFTVPLACLISVMILCLHFPGPRPTMKELISMKWRDGSGRQLRIIDEITSHKSTQCRDFAHTLLNNRSTVSKLQNKTGADVDEFIRAVLEKWLDRDDDNEYEDSVPCTWENLMKCVHDAGLRGELVKLIRDNIPRGERNQADKPVDFVLLQYTISQ